jgi:hypothetical protein
MKTARRRHEVRDEDGHLVAVIEVVASSATELSPDTVDLSVDTGGSSYKVRIFNPAIATARRAA